MKLTNMKIGEIKKLISQLDAQYNTLSETSIKKTTKVNIVKMLKFHHVVILKVLDRFNNNHSDLGSTEIPKY